MNQLTRGWHVVSEQIAEISRSILPWTWVSPAGVRGWFGHRFSLRFWPTHHPAAEGTEVNYDVLRSLYRNDGDRALGAGFAKPIIDLQVGFMGLPTASTENDAETQFLNECLREHWADELQQMFRDAMRDSKCIVKLVRPDLFDPLMTIDESEHFSLEVFPPETVDIEYNTRNKRIIERAVIHHRMVFITDPGDPSQGRDPVAEEHDVLEVITRQSYMFFDQTTSQWLDNMRANNPWNFVPLVEVYNEWDASLQGGQSDLETVVPFINAFHDVLTQTLQAHGYHSTPKVKLKLEDVGPFIKNNFPDAWDAASGTIKPQTEVSWKGRELLLLQSTEDAEFLEARSVLGDSKTILEFLIDCICIASQTPEWAFMRVDSGSANSDRNAQTVPLIKKIARKRTNYTKPVQQLLKMALVAQSMIPVKARISWDVIRPDDQVVTMQAFQQLVMGLEIARQRGEISDATYQDAIRTFLPWMGSNATEKSQPDQPAQPQLPPAQPAIKSGA